MTRPPSDGQVAPLQLHRRDNSDARPGLTVRAGRRWELWVNSVRIEEEQEVTEGQRKTTKKPRRQMQKYSG